jgi:hypothetical protein
MSLDAVSAGAGRRFCQLAVVISLASNAGAQRVYPVGVTWAAIEISHSKDPMLANAGLAIEPAAAQSSAGWSAHSCT